MQYRTIITLAYIQLFVKKGNANETIGDGLFSIMEE